MRLLLVDDSRVARMLTRHIVETAHPDWTIVEAASGEEALDCAAAERPDYILIDITMPGMGGLKAAELLQQRCPTTAIAFVSANIQGPVQQKVQALGLPFITKPARSGALLAFLGDGARP